VAAAPSASADPAPEFNTDGTIHLHCTSHPAPILVLGTDPAAVTALTHAAQHGR
jgi:hypothetical protein